MDRLRTLQQLLFLEFQDRYETDEIFFRKENSIMFQPRDKFVSLPLEQQANFADFVTRETIRQKPDLLEYMADDCINMLKTILKDKTAVNQTGISNGALIYRELPDNSSRKRQLRDLLQRYRREIDRVS
jgi:hypothetical protein